MTEKYNITGMSCAACCARVQKAVAAVNGVEECSVNLLTNSLVVIGNVATEAVIEAVTKAGYGASPVAGNGKINKERSLPQKNNEIAQLRNRLIGSACLLAPLLYLTMGQMLSLPYPDFFAKNITVTGFLELFLTLLIAVVNRSFFFKGYKNLFHFAPTMDTLVALSATAAFLYSAAVLYSATESNGIPKDNLYFESTAMILTIITLGKLLEAVSKGKTASALQELMAMAPKKATVLRNGREVTVPVEEVAVADIFVIRPGETVAVDGIVIAGESAIDEAAITGESIPAEKTVGSKVFGGTRNISGFIKVQATDVGENTALGKIIQLISDASASKAPIAQIADKVSGLFVPAVMVIATVTFILWLLTGSTVGYALARGISVLIISCPCALGLATPVAIMVGSGVGAKNGILFKTAEALEVTGKTKIVALDKTGTVTKGNPVLTDILPGDGITAEALLRNAAALEYKSEHPLGQAIVAYAQNHHLEIAESTNFTAISGNGVMAEIGNHEIIGGNVKFIAEKISLSEDILIVADKLAAVGKTPLVFCADEDYLGIIAVADEEKDTSAFAVAELKKAGIRVVMLTGDNENTARSTAAKVGIAEVYAGLLPAEKKTLINRLMTKGTTLMVGDGINDAPALVTADIGVAIGAGTDVAIDSATVVLTRNDLYDVVNALKLSRATLRNIKENLFWAFLYNTIGIPLAAGVFIPLLGWELNPMFGALAMSLSSICVVSNALRLNFFKFDNGNKVMKENKEENEMKITLKIEGMMCPHCEANVKNALEALDSIVTAEVSAGQGTAIITLAKETDPEILKDAVEKQGYKVVTIL